MYVKRLSKSNASTLSSGIAHPTRPLVVVPTELYYTNVLFCIKALMLRQWPIK